MDKKSLIPIGIKRDDNQGFEVTASSNHISSYNAFDGVNKGSYPNSFRSSIRPELPGYLEVLFPRKYEICGYKVFIGYPTDEVALNMKSWDFEVLVNDEWIVVHSGENPTQVSNTLAYSFAPVVASGVKIKCKERYGSNSWGINGLEVYEYSTTRKILFKSNNEIQILNEFSEWADTGLTEPLTQIDFETHGMDSLSVIPKAKWQELDDNFEVITWTDEGPVKFEDKVSGSELEWAEEGKLFEMIMDDERDVLKLNNVEVK